MMGLWELSVLPLQLSCKSNIISKLKKKEKKRKEEEIYHLSNSVTLNCFHDLP